MTGSNSTQSKAIRLLTLVEPHSCSYLSGRQSNSIFVDPSEPPTWQQYSHLSRMGFRRSGSHYYRPYCPQCNECKASRIVVDDFKWNKRFKRIINKNKDLTARLTLANYSDEHYALYDKYICARHADGDMHPPDPQQFRDFLCTQSGFSHFLDLKLGNRLIACAAVDLLDDGVSAIYTFFDPNFNSRSLGVYAVLSQINYAQDQALPYVYLGYWVKDSQKMNYKTEYAPLQLYENDEWIDF